MYCEHWNDKILFVSFMILDSLEWSLRRFLGDLRSHDLGSLQEVFPVDFSDFYLEIPNNSSKKLFEAGYF